MTGPQLHLWHRHHLEPQMRLYQNHLHHLLLLVQRQQRVQRDRLLLLLLRQRRLWRLKMMATQLLLHLRHL